MPRAKKKSAKGSNFKEDDSALVLMCYYSMPLGVSMYILAPVNADLYIESGLGTAFFSVWYVPFFSIL